MEHEAIGRHESNFTKRAKNIGVPTDQFVVIGGGLLDVLGIRAAQDVDAVLSRQAFDSLLDNDEWTLGDSPTGQFLAKDGYELWRDWSSDGSDHPDFDDLLPSTVMIEGVRYVTPEYLIARKRQMGRDKDFEDIRKLESYLEDHNV